LSLHSLFFFHSSTFHGFLFISLFLSSIPYRMVVFPHTHEERSIQKHRTVNLLVSSNRSQVISLKTWTQYLRSGFEPVTTKSKWPRRILVSVGDSWNIQLLQLFFVYLH
jgi:hypothetical protein